MNLKIIQLGLMDLNDCVDLDQKSLNGLWSKSQWKKELTNPKTISIGIREFETKKLVALCSAWLVIDELHITFMAVHPLHRRKGLGKSLFSDLIKRSKKFQTNQIHLEVKDSNESAKAFYNSMGLKTVGKRINFYKDGSNAVLFNKEINTNHKINN
tara:strand:- start:1051 stop:1518 length:468 start_codon:yes stop_codon:yes gene_type:complete